MQAAIALLEASLENLKINEPIHRSEGRVDQADHDAKNIIEIEDALWTLKNIEGVCRKPGAHAPTMRAKLRVVSNHSDVHDETWQRETIDFCAVADKPYDPESGVSEDSTFSKWTPTATLHMIITNPALFGKIVEGDKYYLDFIKAES